MMVPPTKLRLFVISPVAFESTLFIKTPKTENTTENPSTKNTVFRIMLSLLMDNTEPEDVIVSPFFLELSSETVVPEMYARKAGIIGKMQGATNELRPASKATRIVTSAMELVLDFSFKAFFHISPQSFTIHF